VRGERRQARRAAAAACGVARLQRQADRDEPLHRPQAQAPPAPPLLGCAVRALRRAARSGAARRLLRGSGVGVVRALRRSGALPAAGRAVARGVAERAGGRGRAAGGAVAGIAAAAAQDQVAGHGVLHACARPRAAGAAVCCREQGGQVVGAAALVQQRRRGRLRRRAMKRTLANDAGKAGAAAAAAATCLHTLAEFVESSHAAKHSHQAGRCQLCKRKPATAARAAAPEDAARAALVGGTRLAGQRLH